MIFDNLSNQKVQKNFVLIGLSIFVAFRLSILCLVSHKVLHFSTFDSQCFKLIKRL